MNQNNADIDDTEIRTPRVEPEPVDRGKDVLGTDHRYIGMVTDVEGDTLYVDPNTGLSDSVKRELDWDVNHSTNLPLTSEFIDQIDEEVHLTVTRDGDV